ncbi:MAG TPA: hypothetical protein VNU26_12680 [Mycobacteriales bacterium]|nr:hypothetical protein [Mycobacteriales bacterium]
MLVLYALGALGAVVLLASLLLGDTVDAAVDALDVGPGVTAALGAALTAVGFGGALLAGPLGLLGGVVAGVALGFGVGVATLALVRLALGGSPDRAPSSTDLLGLFGTLATAVPDGGFGAVDLPVGGSRVRLSARSDHPLEAGTSVYVTEVLSPTAVVVAPAGPLS